MSDSGSDSSSDDYYGPALPPGFKQGGPVATEEKKTESLNKREDAQIGPVLPPALRAKLEASAPLSISTEAEQSTSGPCDNEQSRNESGNSDSESDSEVIGPLPPDHPKAQRQVIGSSVSSSSVKEKPKREEWMLVPPKNKIIPGLGLGPRKFLTRTPLDSKNSDEEEDEEEIFAREADAEIERKLIDDYDQKMEDLKKDFEAKKRRNESLLEMHQKDMKKKKNEKEEQAERKPFDRDTDLQISGISSTDKQKYIEKSKELNTKFSRGSRKYL